MLPLQGYMSAKFLIYLRRLFLQPIHVDHVPYRANQDKQHHFLLSQSGLP